MSLFADLVINSVQTPGLPSWQANHRYNTFNESGFVQQYTYILIDVNGNYQVCINAPNLGGLSGSSIDFSGTEPGDITVDNEVSWQCCLLYESSHNQIPYTGIIQL